MWSQSVTIEFEIKENLNVWKYEIWKLEVKTKIKVEFWRMQRPGVALVHEFKANDKSEEIKMHELSVKKEIKMDELSVMNLNQKLKMKKSKWLN